MRLSLYLLVFCSLFLASRTASAQGAHPAHIRMGKVDRPGLAVEYPFSKAIVEAALRGRLERAGLGRPKSGGKGILLYEGAKWAEFSNTQVDIYAMVDAERDTKSNIILLVSKGYDNYVTEASDPELFTRLKAFLDGLLPDIIAAQLAADIAAQEGVIQKAQKDYDNVEDKGKKLEREKEKIERQISENESDKRKSADALSAARARLEQLRADVKK